MFPLISFPAMPMQNVPANDPFAELTSLLNNLEGRQIQPPQQNTLQTVLNAIASGAAIAASNDPGATLTNQLNQRQQRQDQFTLLNEQNKQRIEQIKIQIAGKKAEMLAEEGVQARKDARQDFYNARQLNRESKAKVDVFQQTSDIEADNAIDLIRRKEALDNEFEAPRLIREKNRVFIQDFPKQRQDALDWSARALMIMPEIGMQAAQELGDKIARQDPLTAADLKVANKVNKEFARLAKADKDLKTRETESQITLNEANAEYARMGKPGSTSFQDRFANAYNQALGSQMVRSLDDKFYRTPDGRILTLEELQKLDIIQDAAAITGAKPLSPEENQAEVLRRVQKIKQFQQQQKTEQQQQQINQTTPQDMKGISEKTKRAFQVGRERGYTPEQMRFFLSTGSVGASQAEIDKLVPVQQGQTQAKPMSVSPTFLNPSDTQNKLDPNFMKQFNRTNK